MKVDIRLEAAKYYDSNPDTPNDIPFYLAKIPSTQASVLELGCGTGRVTLALAPHCSYIHGIDLSPAMLSVFREKLAKTDLPAGRVQVEESDITDFDLGRTFDLIIAPFRVMQNLETDAQVDGLFTCIHRHLAPGGSCILNVFKPLYDPQGLRERWSRGEETLDWEVPVKGGRLACYDRRVRMDPEKLILYPELIYRRFEGETLQEESILKIPMRCYYPDDFVNLIRKHGFQVLERWGGYQGEVYGQGPELVVQFSQVGSSQAIQLVLAFNDALNARDLDGMMRLLTADTIFENTYPPPDGQRFAGQAAVRSFWQEFFQASSSARIEPEEIFAAGERVVMRWVYRWTDGNGKEGHIRGVDVYTLRDGLIAEKLSYVKG